MSCNEQLSEALLAFEYQALENDERAALAEHLEGCPSCRAAAARLKEAVLTLKTSGPGPEAIWERAGEAAAKKGITPAPSVVASGLAVSVKIECSYCKAELGESESVHCARCLARYHEDCFRENGACGIIGCEGTSVLRPVRVSRSRSRLGRFAGGAAIVIGVGVAVGVAGLTSLKRERARAAELEIARRDAEAQRAAAEASLAKLGRRGARQQQRAQTAEFPPRLMKAPTSADEARERVQAPSWVRLGGAVQIGQSLRYERRTARGRVDVHWTVTEVFKDRVTLETNEPIVDSAWDWPELADDVLELSVLKLNGRVLKANVITHNTKVTPVRRFGPRIAVLEQGEVRASFDFGQLTLHRLGFQGSVYELAKEGPTAGLPYRILRPSGELVELVESPQPGESSSSGQESKGPVMYRLKFDDGEFLCLTRDPVVVALRPYGPTGWGVVTRQHKGETLTLMETREAPLNLLLDREDFLKQQRERFAALREVERLLRADPKDREALFKKGLGQARLKKFAEATETWKVFIEAFPEDPRVPTIKINLERMALGLGILERVGAPKDRRRRAAKAPREDPETGLARWPWAFDDDTDAYTRRVCERVAELAQKPGIREAAAKDHLVAPGWIHLGEGLEVHMLAAYKRSGPAASDPGQDKLQYRMIKAIKGDVVVVETNAGMSVWAQLWPQLAETAFVLKVDRKSGAVKSAEWRSGLRRVPVKHEADRAPQPAALVGIFSGEMRFNGATYTLRNDGLPTKIVAPGRELKGARISKRAYELGEAQSIPCMVVEFAEGGEVLWLSRDPIIAALRPFGPTGWGLVSRRSGDRSLAIKQRIR